MNIAKYIAKLEIKGILYFTLEEMHDHMKMSKESLRKSIYYFKKKGVIVSPLRGFYVIVPTEHRAIGSLPPEELIVVMMKHLNCPYYAGLLTAAAYHGATHQRLRVFQVVSSKRFYQDVIIGDVWIEFIYKKEISHVVTKRKVVRTGYLPMTTPEETAKDIMMYYKKSGGLNHQATVLSELVKVIMIDKIILLAKKSKNFLWVQRIGYIMENIDTFYEKERDNLVIALHSFLASQKLRYIPLAPDMSTVGKKRNRKWKIIENATITPDI